MKIHYKGMTINQQWCPPTLSPQWLFGSRTGYIGYGVVGLCMPELRSVADARKMIDRYVAGDIIINNDAIA